MNPGRKPDDRAAEALRRALHQINIGSSQSATERAARLRQAIKDSEEGRRLLEDALIDAEREAMDGHGNDNGEEDSP